MKFHHLTCWTSCKLDTLDLPHFRQRGSATNANGVALVAVPLPPTQALQLLFPKAGQRISDGKRHLRVKANANGQPRPIVQRPNAVAANGFKQMSRPPQILKKGPEPSVCYGKRNMCFWPVGAGHDGIHAGSKWHLGKRTHCNAVQFTMYIYIYIYIT